MFIKVKRFRAFSLLEVQPEKAIKVKMKIHSLNMSLVPWFFPPPFTAFDQDHRRKNPDPQSEMGLGLDLTPGQI